MSNKIVSKLTAGAEHVKNVATDTFQVAGKTAKQAGTVLSENALRLKTEAESTVSEAVEKFKEADKPTFASVKKDTEAVVAQGIKQLGEVEWKKEFERIKNLELPVFTNLKPIDWASEHVKLWKDTEVQKPAAETENTNEELGDITGAVIYEILGSGVGKTSFSLDALSQEKVELDSWPVSDEPHQLISGPPVGFTIVHNPDGTTSMVQYKGFTDIDAKDPVYLDLGQELSDGEPLVIIDGNPGGGKTGRRFVEEFLAEEERLALLSRVSASMNEVLKKEEDKLSFEDSKAKDAKPVAVKKATPAKKTGASKDPVITVLGSDAGQVEPLGTEYKKLIRKVAKQAEKNADVKLYLSGKTYGIGARGTVENIDGNDVSVFHAKDIKKLLAKIS